MRIFISYKFTGVPLADLNSTVVPLISKLREAGFDVFCNLERDSVYVQEKWTATQIMDECFTELDKCNYHITFVAPDTAMGEGMLIELGYACKMKIPTMMLLPDKFRSISAKAVVDDIITYSDMNDLLEKLIDKII